MRGAAQQRRGQDGLTLIELMVSALLASLLIGGLFFMMSGQQITYSDQINKTVAQQNLWGTMSYVQRWIRSAGYGLGSCPAFNGSEVGRVHMRRTDTSSMASPLVAIEVFNNCNLYTTTPAGCAANTDPDVPGVDSFKVTRVHPSAMATSSLPSVIMKATMLSNAAPIELPTSADFPPRFEATGAGGSPELVVLWDPSSGPCIVLEVTGVSAPPDVELAHAAKDPYNGGDWWLAAPMSKSTGFGVATRVTRLAPLSYPRIFAIDQVNRRLMTWQTMAADPKSDMDNGTLEVVAEQIEDMQLTTGCDSLGGGNGTLDEGTTGGGRQSDEWAYNVAGDTPPSCGEKPIGAVRVTLISRSDSEVVGGTATGARPATEDRPAGAVDRFSRSVLTSTIKTINLRVQ